MGDSNIFRLINISLLIHPTSRYYFNRHYAVNSNSLFVTDEFYPNILCSIDFLDDTATLICFVIAHKGLNIVGTNKNLHVGER